MARFFGDLAGGVAGVFTSGGSKVAKEASLDIGTSFAGRSGLNLVQKNFASGLVETGGELAVKTGGEEASQLAAKNAAGLAAINAAEAGGGEASQLAAKNADEIKAEAGLLQKSWNKIYNNPKNTAAALAATGLSIAAIVEMQRKEGIVFKINSIKNNEQKTSVITGVIKFTPSIKWSLSDTLKIKDTNSVPKLEGDFKIKNINSESELVIVMQEKITTDGTDGTMTVDTDFFTQFGQAAGAAGGKAAGAAVETGLEAASAASDPLFKAFDPLADKFNEKIFDPINDLFNNVGGGFKNLFDNFGGGFSDLFTGIFENIIMIIVVIIAFFMLFSIVKSKIVSSV